MAILKPKYIQITPPKNWDMVVLDRLLKKEGFSTYTEKWREDMRKWLGEKVSLITKDEKENDFSDDV